ncbi:acyl-CoA thioesterase [Novosphingobium chloroacetimidivorans]|uniref:Acyl-CoA thioesterase n=1 Tax=Novosphingobium chloroacetimidivorans TaxID=1428314 RepID=A0A7W7KCP8_9SPHN|nr:thioesterase family protein [Novosphingobium chloroacetimidivorans]MBB4859798.1 acyl-CoA thioesterase [Novosphingobium chloroacetimidivorans]
MSFAELLASGDGSFVVPESWHQGRTAYGGFSSALTLAQAMHVGGDLPPLRSAQIAMMAPIFGEVQVSARVMREGRNATWIAAEITGDKGVGTAANFVFMRPVESSVAVDDVPPPTDLIAVDEARPFDNPNAPAFLRNHFDVRFARPRRDGRSADVCWWVRPKSSEGLDPALALLLTADGLPPAVMPMLSAYVPVSTMHWQVNLLTAAPQTQDGWWLLRSSADFARQGCSSQRMQLWNSDGEPVLAGTQSIALFG